ncbi:SCO family protein [Oceanobacillus sp. CAU 1775]
MITKHTKRAILGLIVLLGAFLVIKLFEINNRLPYIAEVNANELDSVLTEEYSFDNESIKIVAFIFTNCPDICPMTMVDLAVLQEQLKVEAMFGTDVDIVTITLDPEVDTEEVLKNYAANFSVDSTGWYILRGTKGETKEIAEQFGMYYMKDENGFVTHSTNMYLVDRENQIRATHAMNIAGKQVNTEKLMENISRLLDE